MKSWHTEISIEGLNMERCIQKCSEQEIKLYQLNRKDRILFASVQEDQLDRLSCIASQGGWLLKVGRRQGVGRFLESINRRWILVACASATAVLLFLSTTMLLHIEIHHAGAYLGEIKATLDQEGIRAPSWKKGVDLSDLRDCLEYKYPDIAWIECGWRGSTLLISVHEGITSRDAVSIDGRADIIASRDGIVESIVTLAGTAVVKQGQTIKQGQLLIRGEERGADETVHPVSARGYVQAKVWDAATVCISAIEYVTHRTGKTESQQTLRLPWFPLTYGKHDAYEQKEIVTQRLPLGGLFFPVTVCNDLISEIIVQVQKKEEEQLKAEAAALALKKLREKVGMTDKLIDKWVEYSTIEDGMMQAVGYGERLIDIGIRSVP